MSETIKVGRKLQWAQNAVETIYTHNKSGGSVEPGDTVILDTANSSSTEVAFTTTATADNKLVLGMSIENIANNGYGEIQTKGPTSLLKVNGTVNIAVGDAISTYTSVKIGQQGTSGKGGAFAVALAAYSTGDSLGVIDAWLTGSAARIDTSSQSATYASPTLTGTVSVNGATTFNSTGTITLDGVASGTDSLTVALGDISITDGDLNVSEINGTSTVVTLDHETGVMAADNALLFLDDGGNIASGGNMLRLVPNATPDAASILFEIVGADKIGQAMYVDEDPTGINVVHFHGGGALTDGKAVVGITSDGAIATGGALLNLTYSGSPGSTAVRMFEIADGTNDVIAMYIDSDAATESAIQITGAGNVANDKAMLHVTNTSTAAVSGASLIRLDGAFTTAGGDPTYGMTINMTGATCEGLWVEEGTSLFAEAVTIGGNAKLLLRDSNTYIYSSAGSQLDIVAATLLHLDSPIEVGENSAGHDVTFFCTTASYKVWLDVSGETGKGIWNFGADTKGPDVKFFGISASAYMLWDASADDLILSGASGLKMGASTTLVIPVKVSGSAVAGDLWLDTSDNKLHFYNGSAEKTVTDS